MQKNAQIKECLGCKQKDTCFWGIQAQQIGILSWRVPASDCYYKNGQRLLKVHNDIAGC